MDVDRRGFDRRQTDLVLGEMVGTIKEMKEDLRSLRESTEENRQRISNLHDEVTAKFNTAETVFKTLKVVGLVIIAVATFKFGDIKGILTTLFR